MTKTLSNIKNITIPGRILYAILFAVFGINHFLMMGYYAGIFSENEKSVTK